MSGNPQLDENISKIREQNIETG